MLNFEKLQSPAFKAMVGIAAYVGPGMCVTQRHSMAFPVGTVQVWKFTPATPPRDRLPILVAVRLIEQKLESWTPLLEADFATAVAHYEGLAHAAWQTLAVAPIAPVATAETVPTQVMTVNVPAGIRLHWSGPNGQPPLLAGKPVHFVIGRAAGAS